MSTHTVANFERGVALKTSTVELIQRMLEKAGIIFIDENDGGPGAKLRTQVTDDPPPEILTRRRRRKR